MAVRAVGRLAVLKLRACVVATMYRLLFGFERARIGGHLWVSVTGVDLVEAEVPSSVTSSRRHRMC